MGFSRHASPQPRPRRNPFCRQLSTCPPTNPVAARTPNGDNLRREEPCLYTLWRISDYQPGDETSWLRCRVLGFLDTSYFDDVVVRKPRHRVELVAVSDGEVLGVCDVSVAGDAATIETIAVPPDHRRNGIAHRLANTAGDRARDLGATSLDAWTREDPPALAWYRAAGFHHNYRYLHVYASSPKRCPRQSPPPRRSCPAAATSMRESNTSHTADAVLPRARLQPVRQTAL